MIETWNWEGLFSEVGFSENGVRAEFMPDMPTLYRASVRGVVGMSWTDNLKVAEQFHARNIAAGHDAVILKLEDAPYDALLARFHGPESRDEAEWVLLCEYTDYATELD